MLPAKQIVGFKAVYQVGIYFTWAANPGKRNHDPSNFYAEWMNVLMYRQKLLVRSVRIKIGVIVTDVDPIMVRYNMLYLLFIQFSLLGFPYFKFIRKF